jgi:hypothetical protein
MRQVLGARHPEGVEIMRTRGGRFGVGAALLAAAALGGAAALPLRAQPPAQDAPAQDAAALLAASPAPAELPFGVGERLTYQVKVARVGAMGRGAMTVDGPVDVRGQAAYHLRFGFSTRVGPVKVVNESESWLDPRGMRSLRFHKHEKHPLSRHDERVELYPEARRWEGLRGERGESPSDRPLDELSFLYFLRTLALAPDSVYRFERHFDAGRNPTSVRLVGREPVVTPAGRFRTLLIEMRVRDPRRYKTGEGVIWINLSDDRCRLPVRIQSQVPVAGAAVLTLESHTHPREHLALAP